MNAKRFATVRPALVAAITLAALLAASLPAGARHGAAAAGPETTTVGPASLAGQAMVAPPTPARQAQTGQQAMLLPAYRGLEPANGEPGHTVAFGPEPAPSSTGGAASGEVAAAAAPAGTLSVDTLGDVVDGDTSSVANLRLHRGVDGLISFREAILAINATGPGYVLVFNLPHGATILLVSTVHLTSAAPQLTATQACRPMGCPTSVSTARLAMSA